MSHSGDIRSFFSPSNKPSPSNKRKAIEEIVDACKKAKQDGQDEIKDSKQSSPSKDGAEQDDETNPTTDDVAKPIVHSLANLAKNAKVLMHESWFAELETEFQAPYFKRLVQFLAKEEAAKKTIYPPPEHVFAALRDYAFSSLKVVIIGQDPYHGPNQAHGLCFSVQHGIPPPPSLKNIFKEAMADVKIQKPTHGCLTSWSEQGVLLLNTVLTVRRGEPNSHKGQGWEKFTDALIDHVNRHGDHLVFLLWGKPAQVKGARIDTRKHLVLTSSHPSPLGATKTNAPFIGSKCFSRANEYLKKHDKTPIDWNVV